MLPGNDDKDTTDASRQYQLLIDHYFDHYNFEDARLLRSPIYLDLKNYFFEVLPQEPQLIVQKANEFLGKFNDRESYKYYTALLVNLVFFCCIVRAVPNANSGFARVTSVIIA